MNKKFKLVLITLLLIIPNIVKASYVAPIQATFDVVVINNSGINYYDYDENNNKIDKHFNKGDIFTVISKNCDDCNTYIIEYNGERNFIETLNGTKLINDRIIPHEGDDNIIAISTNNEALIYAEDGVDIRRGPNEVYEKVDHLKKGTRIKYTYYYSGGGITHIYVDNNGIRGWIDITKSKVLIEAGASAITENKKYIVSKDINMNCATIPRNTIITPTFVSDEWSRQVLLEYSNCKMLYTLLDNENNKKINLEEFTQEEIIETAQKEMGIYEYSYNNGKKIDTILEGETYQVLAKDPYRVFPEIEYISYNGKEGWIKLTDTDNTTEDNDQNNIKVHKTNYLIIAIIACSVIIIVTVVTILLINKKNKNTKKEIND